MKTIRILYCGALCAFAALAQGTVNGDRHFLGQMDASGATLTAPLRFLASEPATCDNTKHEIYYNTATTKARICNALNTWSDFTGSLTIPPPGPSSLGGVNSKDCSSLGSTYMLQKVNTDGSLTCANTSAGGGASSTSQLLDDTYALTSSTVITNTIPTGGTNYGTLATNIAAQTQTITVTSCAAGTKLFAYFDPSTGQRKLDTTAANFTGFTISGGYTLANANAVDFPTDIVRVATLQCGSPTANQWNASNPITDNRSFLSATINKPQSNGYLGRNPDGHGGWLWSFDQTQLSALLDAALGSTVGNVATRGAGGWTSSAPSGGGSSVVCDPTTATNLCIVTYPGIYGLANSHWSGFHAGSAPSDPTTSGPDANHSVGSAIQFSTGATINSYAQMISVGAANGAYFLDPFSTTGTYTWLGSLQLGQTANSFMFAGLENGVAPGISSTTGTANAYEIGVEYDTSQSDTNFMCVYKNAFVNGNRLSIGVSADTSWHTYSVSKVDSTHIKCSVDSTSVTMTIAGAAIGSTQALYGSIMFENLSAANATFNHGPAVKIYRTGLPAAAGF